MRVFILAAFLAAACTCQGGFDDEEWTTLSTGLSPDVRFAATASAQKLIFGVDVATQPYAAKARLALCSSNTTAFFDLAAFPATIQTSVKSDQKLRYALEVTWFNTNGSVRQREVFHAPSAANELSTNSLSWGRFDFQAYRMRIEENRRKIRIPVEQPLDGRLTVVIENAQGLRIRNVISGLEKPQGKHRIEWDGLDEFGRLVAPGSYRFRTVSHAGITPEFLMQFANGDESFFTPFGSNHGIMTALAATTNELIAAAPLTEGGFSVVTLAPNGSFIRGFPEVNGSGIEEVFVATDNTTLFVVKDGGSWGGGQGQFTLTITRFDSETGRILPPQKSNKQFAVVKTYPTKKWEPGETRTYALAGAAYFRGALYVADQLDQVILVLDPETCQETMRIPLAAPGPLAASHDTLYAVSGTRVIALDPATHKLRPVLALDYRPRGLCADAQHLFVTGNAASTVEIHALNGAPLRTLGTPGGAYQGKWDEARLVNPVGLALAPDGALWVAEKRANPKRLSKWDLATGTCVYSKIGCPAYGSPAAGFDPQKPTRWIGQHCLWEIDTRTGKATILAVLQKADGHLNGKIPECLNYKFVHQDGRIFVLGDYKATLISELMPDGSLRDLAFVSQPHALYYGLHWVVDPVVNPLIEKRFHQAKRETKYNHASCRYVGVLWIDQNGNNDMDENEFQFTPEGSYCGEYDWGARFDNLTLVLPYCTETKTNGILTLTPAGYNSVGAPNYSFERALAAFKPLQQPLPEKSNRITDTPLNDRFGNVIVNSDPYMFSFTQSGSLNWFFQNKWSNVHGSHGAPLPKPGELQGTLFGIGTAPLDAAGDVAAFVGNHGRLFLLTTDGLYLDELFSDCRVAEVTGPGLIGGEAFGGCFDYDRVNKRPILQVGTSGYRLYALKGLDTVQRSAGTFTVTREQIQTAAALLEKQQLAAATPKHFTLTATTGKTPARDVRNKPRDIAWGGDPNRTIELRALCDATHLYLTYHVPDTSPWVNTGKDWTQLFKTGDSVDLQIGLNPAAPPDRRTPVVGDCRLLFAPFEGKPIAVLYRHRLADKSGANTVTFTCPWRSETVDDVRRLDTVKLDVEPSNGGYRLTAAVPLADLGLVPHGTFKADFGVIFGDREGTINLARVYWANPATGLVNDVPGEIMLNPALWGQITFGN